MTSLWLVPTCVNYLHKLYTYFKNNQYTMEGIFLCCQNLDVNSAVNNLLSRDDEDGAGDGMMMLCWAFYLQEVSLVKL